MKRRWILQGAVVLLFVCGCSTVSSGGVSGPTRVKAGGEIVVRGSLYK
ncbi:MAG TPA: hypothetical protein PLO62_14395 [Candidatus Hydrogenedentes bacterium]|nr:hypothetical protein [Candidatus Hydrogenedentota bacterium]